MPDTVIHVENLNKKYIIGHQKQERYTALRDVITNGMRNAGRKLWRLFCGTPSAASEPAYEEFWALKDVSFEIKQGERVGIIGRNGAGKSTLLKVLSRITEPTSGRIHIKGRIASLLEVGTGFHPELTGRENIFLNGAILGMSKTEIKRKFDEIVAFAEVERFLDTPVKRYSSGMYVRLAFAVVAHLEPEILLVDEVLAVGDAQFQKKCLSKMEDVSAQEGRTVLFVSHNMGAISQLCSKAFLLNQGSIVKEAATQQVIDYYLSEASASSQCGFLAGTNSSKEMFIARAQPLNSAGEIASNFTHKEEITVGITCKINQWIPNTVMGFFVQDQRGRKVFSTNNPAWEKLSPQESEIYATVVIPPNFLVPGQYFFTFAISVPHAKIVDLAEDAFAITIIDGGSVFASYEGYDYGCVFADCKWSIGNGMLLN
jgi:lipopolysaccharide transport system ATP-binding protein